MQQSPFKELTIWLLLAILYYAAAVQFGASAMANFREFMFADYVALWHKHYSWRMPSWSNPFILLLVVIFLWKFRIRGLIIISRTVCAVIAAIFLVRLVVFVLNLYPVYMTLPYALTGALAFIWYVLSAYMIYQNLRGQWVAFIVRMGTD